MDMTLSWFEIGLRLTLAVIAGFALGYDRGSREHSAGLRTTMLVCLAATVAMIQVNVLLATTTNLEGHTLTLDLMRLPLGILSGVGFIGAGTILRRGNKVEGVTTAATLWFVTVIGLCFGGGQYLLGLASTVLALIVASIFRFIEPLILPWRRGKVTATVARSTEAGGALDDILRVAGVVVLSRHIARDVAKQTSSIDFEVRYSLLGIGKSSQILDRLEACEGVVSASWEDEVR